MTAYSALDVAKRLLKIAFACGQVILEQRQAGLPAHTKADGSPVCAADLASHAAGMDALQDAFPDVPVVSEEGAQKSDVTPSTPAFFLFDPLDGTRGFLAGGDDFAVNIALVERGVPTLGVIVAPAHGVGLAGFSGQLMAAHTDPDGSLHYASFQPARNIPDRALVSHFHGDNKTRHFLEDLGGFDALPYSSALKFVMLAKGEARLYPRYGATSEWDTAAGQALVVAAGGHMVGLDGEPLRYGRSVDQFINPPFLAMIGYSGLDAESVLKKFQRFAA